MEIDIAGTNVIKSKEKAPKSTEKYPAFSSWAEELEWFETGEGCPTKESGREVVKRKRGSKEIQLDLFSEAKNG